MRFFSDEKCPSSHFLYQRRKGLKGEMGKRLLFQLITDGVYGKEIESLALDNKKIVLCAQKSSDGYGDVGQTYLCAALIRKHFPDFEITVVLDATKDNSAEKIKQIFSTEMNDFQTFFLPAEPDVKLAKMKEHETRAGCLLGIALPLEIGPSRMSPLEMDYLAIQLLAMDPSLIDPRGMNPWANDPLTIDPWAIAPLPKCPLAHGPYIVIREFGSSQLSKFNPLQDSFSMGFAPCEEGISFPAVTDKPLADISTPWLSEALNQKNASLYHMYGPSWSFHILSLYIVAMLEKDSDHEIINVFMPLQYSVANLIKWGALNKEVLVDGGIEKIICRGPNSDIEVVSFTKTPGKTLQIIKGPIAQNDLQIIQKHAHPFFGCTGDVTYGAAMQLEKLPFYCIRDHKRVFVESWAALAREQGFENLSQFISLIMQQYELERSWYEEHLIGPNKLYKRPAEFDLNKEYSIPRFCLENEKDFSISILMCAKSLFALHQTAPLLKEAQDFAKFAKAHVNFEPRLIAFAIRGLILRNHPKLLEIEGELWEKFSKDELTEEELAALLHDSCKQQVTTTFSPASDC